MDWKEFLKPTKIKLVMYAILFILLIFFGFIRTDTDLAASSCTGLDCPVQRTCGLEGIFNPLLRPVSFVIVNIVQGLLMNKDIVLCGVGPVILFWPLDTPYLYVLSCFAVSIFRRYKK